MISFTAAYYGLDRFGRWTVMLCREWMQPGGGRSGGVTERFIECSDEAEAKRTAYGLQADFVRTLVH